MTPELTPVSCAADIVSLTHRSALSLIYKSSHAQGCLRTPESPSCVNLDLDRLPTQSRVGQIHQIPAVDIDQARYGVPFRQMWWYSGLPTHCDVKSGDMVNGREQGKNQNT